MTTTPPSGSPRRVVLVVDDEPAVRRSIERILTRENCQVIEARDGREASQRMSEAPKIDLILSDLSMPNADGREVIASAEAHGIPVVIVTGQATVDTAVELMRRGAANFLSKPFTREMVRAVLDDTFGRDAGKRRPVTDRPSLIGTDESLFEVREMIAKVAETDATVIIQGESGTGKEVVARLLHAAGPRANRPFVAINCGAIPEQLIESELFGHARGAFTGATQARAGRFELAEGGTLFLDEVGDMPLAAQVKLLRVLQERQYTPLGDTVARSTDVRIISATHRDLTEAIANNTFREDLLYRLNVVDLKLPALRERKRDIPLLVRHFLQSANERHNRNILEVSIEAMDALCAYDWPGNVRQLANVVERLVVLRRAGSIGLDELPESIRQPAVPGQKAADPSELPAEGIDLKQTIAELEDSLIDQALDRTRGNRNAAARLLGLNRTTLVEKLKRKGKEA